MFLTQKPTSCRAVDTFSSSRNHRLLRAAGTALTLLAGGSLSAQVIHVNAAAPANGNGQSWATAFQDLQQALAVASPGAAIWIAEGTYLPGAAQTSSFVIPSGVKLHGGFLGNELSLAARAGSAQNTVLSGNLDGNPATTNTDAFHVVVIPAGSSGTVLDRLRIEFGNAGTSPSGLGGGIEIGGQSTNWVQDVAVHSCIIENCTARQGGGIAASYVVRLDSKLCTFRNNRARSTGGGVHLYFAGSGDPCAGDGVKFVNAWFTGNTAAQGGGLWNALNDAPVWLANCKFTDNQGSLGGAVYHGDAVLTGSYPLRVANCTIAYNRAFDINGNGSQGAGFYLANLNTQAMLDNTIVWGNVATIGMLNRPASSLEGPGTNPAVLSVRHSDIEIQPLAVPPGSSVWPGPGNINAYPGFTNVNSRNLQLLSFSACIDAGDDFAVPFDYLDLDNDGNLLEQMPRELLLTIVREINDAAVADTGVDDGGVNSFTAPFCGQFGPPGGIDSGIVDMGCHERRAISQ
jgi:hypothetical protein